jgi:hypothetical protein
MTLRLGRQPTVHNRFTFQSGLVMARHLDNLGPAPATSNDWVRAVDANTRGNWGMMGNDRFGDCVKADDGHYLMLRTANVGKMVVPSDRVVLHDYFAQTGGQDTGLDETSDSLWMIAHGMLRNHHAQAAAMVDPTNLDHVRWGCQLFGRTRLGFAVTQKMMDQFNANQPWSDTDVTNSTIIGLHDVPVVRYRAIFNGFEVVTWGRLQQMTMGCYMACCANLNVGGSTGEAHVELFPDWMRTQGTAPNGLDLTQLVADLAAITP